MAAGCLAPENTHGRVARRPKPSPRFRGPPGLCTVCRKALGPTHGSRRPAVPPKHSEAGPKALGTLQSPPPPESPTAPQASRVTHHDFSRPGAGPPCPLPALLGPPAGAGGPTAGRFGPSEAPEAPLRSPLTPPPATRRSQRYVCPSVLSRPRAQHRTFIVTRRPRPSRHVSTAYVNAHVDWRSTRFPPLFSE